MRGGFGALIQESEQRGNGGSVRGIPKLRLWGSVRLILYFELFSCFLSLAHTCICLVGVIFLPFLSFLSFFSWSTMCKWDGMGRDGQAKLLFVLRSGLFFFPPLLD